MSRRNQPTADPEPRRVALRPVEQAVVTAARRQARAAVAAADALGQERLDRARVIAQRLLAAARAEGEAAARRAAALEVADARREARRIVLEARRHMLDDLRRDVLEAVARRAGTPPARRLAAHMEHVVLASVGAGATVEHGGPGGLEVTATTPTRRAALHLADLVERELAARSTDVEDLWA